VALAFGVSNESTALVLTDKVMGVSTDNGLATVHPDVADLLPEKLQARIPQRESCSCHRCAIRINPAARPMKIPSSPLLIALTLCFLGFTSATHAAVVTATYTSAASVPVAENKSNDAPDKLNQRYRYWLRGGIQSLELGPCDSPRPTLIGPDMGPCSCPFCR
jgi:hypothetical protein